MSHRISTISGPQWLLDRSLTPTRDIRPLRWAGFRGRFLTILTASLCAQDILITAQERRFTIDLTPYMNPSPYVVYMVCYCVCLSVCQLVCPFVCLSTRLSGCLYIRQSVCFCVSASVRVFVNRSVCLFVRLSGCLCIRQSVSLDVCLSVGQPVCPSVWLLVYSVSLFFSIFLLHFCSIFFLFFSFLFRFLSIFLFAHVCMSFRVLVWQFSCLSVSISLSFCRNACQAFCSSNCLFLRIRIAWGGCQLDERASLWQSWIMVSEHTVSAAVQIISSTGFAASRCRG